MDYIDRIIKDVIRESVDAYKVIDAIKKRNEVELDYTPNKYGKGGGKRLVEPVAYGTSKAGNPVVRAYQPYGDTATSVPHWKLFRTDKIKGWKQLKKRKFSEPPMFNTQGDGSMSSVMSISDFEGARKRYERGGLKKYNDERLRKAKEANPYYELKRNLSRSVKGSQYDMIMKNLEYSKKEDELRRNMTNNNSTSINDMAWVNPFNTGNEQQTTDPVIRGEENHEAPISQAQNNNNNYTMAYRNGPVMKKRGNQTTNDNEFDNNDEEYIEDNNNERTEV